MSAPKAAKRSSVPRSEPLDPLTNLVLAMPVFVFYHLGLLFTDLRNGADLVTGAMHALLDASLGAYVGFVLAAALGLFIAARMLGRTHALEARAFWRVLGESAVWAVVLLVVVGAATRWVLPGAWAVPAQLGPRTLGPLEALVMSAGAGFHEELLFRVGLFTGGALALERGAGLGRIPAQLIALVASSLVFSAVHYVGPLGDAFTLASFVFRFFMGMGFAGLLRLRGFAVAVYTHTLYDVLVLLVLGG